MLRDLCPNLVRGDIYVRYVAPRDYDPALKPIAGLFLPGVRTRVNADRNHDSDTFYGVALPALLRDPGVASLDLSGRGHFDRLFVPDITAALAESTTLRNLDMSGCDDLSDMLFSVLGAAPDGGRIACPALTWLKLSRGSSQEDDIAHPLAPWVALSKSIGHLELDDTGINDAGAATLGRALGANASLTTLSLSGNYIGDAGSQLG